ncbi:type I restriction-modification system specificity subunit [Pseudomonas sp. MT-1]|uniref:restriction endonuclease subunit S n=1 Tax=Stutzerimonas stutzeri TaxID=316 RepID=UPI000535E6DD|nr:restriction endonuclease subunit S [Stutzerimonas stutzeri]MCQ4282129.1 restriction endonuclease subunit S [Stutzerimonas stutzeri]BAP77616.1 type I restriction-modification system specificity subunit [Pseudomonas sp. MT-1]
MGVEEVPVGQTQTKPQSLRAGWVGVTLGDILTLEYGKSLVKANRAESGDYPVYGSSGIVGFHNEYLINQPAIIVGRKGAAGAVHLCKKKFWPIDTTYFVKVHKSLSIDFIFHLLTFCRLQKYESSTAIPGLNRDHAYAENVSLPPLAEQHRIVTKIEELFSELDKGTENLRTAQQQLKVYRRALLKHAFEGKLTADWRAQNPDKLESADALLGHIQQERDGRYQQLLQDWQAAHKEWEENGKVGSKPSKPKAQKVLLPLTVEELAELPELPKSWAWARVLDACAEVVDCHNKTAPYQSAGIPLVRTPSIRNMKLNFDDSIRYVSSETYQFWSRRCPPEPGDILFTREAPMGEAAIIPEGKKICMGQRIMLLRTYKELLMGKYLLAATQAPTFKRYSNKLAVGTGVKHLRVGDVERLIFPICPINEQIKIVENLDAQFSQLDQLEQTITQSLQQAEALRQSILKKAFSGQLVPQDPNDEPASVLLERIRAERAAQPKARGRKAKA